MSLIDHHFNHFHHCTAESRLCFQNSVFFFFKNKSPSHFCKKLSKFSSSSNVQAQPWSPFPEHIRASPAKNYQKKSLFQPIVFKGKPKSQSLFNLKKCQQPNITKWVLVK